MHDRGGRRWNKAIAVVAVAAAFTAAVAVVSILFVGRLPLTITDWMSMTGLAKTALKIRLPRVLFALITGASLAAAGAAMQAVFRNPLASPSVLGVSQGAAFGAALGILMYPGNAALIEAHAFIFGIIAIASTYALSRAIKYGGAILRLILAGMATASAFNAALGTVKYVADPLRQLPEIVFWLLGSFAGVRPIEVLTAGFAAAAGAAAIVALSWRLNILSLGDTQAKALGVDPKIYRNVAIIASVVSVAAMTAVAGQIGWIGLVAPHLGRKVVGADNRKAIPAAMVLGALTMLVADDIARAATTAEIPLSIVTSAIGVPLFIAILSMKKEKGGIA